MSEISDQLGEARDRLRDQAAASPTYLTVPEAAQLARCNPMTIRRAFTAGALAAFRPAHRVLLREADVLEWIESRPAVAPDRARRTRPPRRRPATNGSTPVPGSKADLREIERNLTR